MEVDQLPECLDTGNHAGCHIVAVQHLPVDSDDGQPSGADELAKQAAVVAVVDPQAFGNGKDHLAVRDRGADPMGDGLGG